eukprot:gene11892-8177_t
MKQKEVLVSTHVQSCANASNSTAVEKTSIVFQAADRSHSHDTAPAVVGAYEYHGKVLGEIAMLVENHFQQFATTTGPHGANFFLVTGCSRLPRRRSSGARVPPQSVLHDMLLRSAQRRCERVLYLPVGAKSSKSNRAYLETLHRAALEGNKVILIDAANRSIAHCKRIAEVLQQERLNFPATTRIVIGLCEPHYLMPDELLHMVGLMVRIEPRAAAAEGTYEDLLYDLWIVHAMGSKAAPPSVQQSFLHRYVLGTNCRVCRQPSGADSCGSPENTLRTPKNEKVVRFNMIETITEIRGILHVSPQQRIRLKRDRNLVSQRFLLPGNSDTSSYGCAPISLCRIPAGSVGKGEFYAVGCASGAVHLLDSTGQLVSEGEQQSQAPPHKSTVWNVRWVEELHRLLTTGEDRCTRALAVRSPPPSEPYSQHYSLAWDRTPTVRYGGNSFCSVYHAPSHAYVVGGSASSGLLVSRDMSDARPGPDQPRSLHLSTPLCDDEWLDGHRRRCNPRRRSYSLPAPGPADTIVQSHITTPGATQRLEILPHQALLVGGTSTGNVFLADPELSECFVFDACHAEHHKVASLATIDPYSWFTGGHDGNLLLWDMRQRMRKTFEFFVERYDKPYVLRHHLRAYLCHPRGIGMDLAMDEAPDSEEWFDLMCNNGVEEKKCCSVGPPLHHDLRSSLCGLGLDESMSCRVARDWYRTTPPTYAEPVTGLAVDGTNVAVCAGNALLWLDMRLMNRPLGVVEKAWNEACLTSGVVISSATQEIVTASADGGVRFFRWDEDGFQIRRTVQDGNTQPYFISCDNMCELPRRIYLWLQWSECTVIPCGTFAVAQLTGKYFFFVCFGFCDFVVLEPNGPDVCGAVSHNTHILPTPILYLSSPLLSSPLLSSTYSTAGKGKELCGCVDSFFFLFFFFFFVVVVRGGAKHFIYSVVVFCFLLCVSTRGWHLTCVSGCHLLVYYWYSYWYWFRIAAEIGATEYQPQRFPLDMVWCTYVVICLFVQKSIYYYYYYYEKKIYRGVTRETDKRKVDAILHRVLLYSCSVLFCFVVVLLAFPPNVSEASLPSLLFLMMMMMIVIIIVVVFTILINFSTSFVFIYSFIYTPPVPHVIHTYMLTRSGRLSSFDIFSLFLCFCLLHGDEAVSESLPRVNSSGVTNTQGSGGLTPFTSSCMFEINTFGVLVVLSLRGLVFLYHRKEQPTTTKNCLGHMSNKITFADTSCGRSINDLPPRLTTVSTVFYHIFFAEMASTKSSSGQPKMYPSATEVRPRVIVFDLDGTLWDPEMYQLHGGAPFKADAKNPCVMIDSSGTRVGLLGETRELLSQLAFAPEWAGDGHGNNKTYLAISSTCDYPKWAEELLQKFTVPHPTTGGTVKMNSVFHSKHIYYASKSQHHKKILQEIHNMDPTVEDVSQMLFFDNQMNNIGDVSKAGVPSCYAPNGMQKGACHNAVQAILTHRTERKKINKYVNMQGRGGFFVSYLLYFRYPQKGAAAARQHNRDVLDIDGEVTADADHGPSYSMDIHSFVGCGRSIWWRSTNYNGCSELEGHLALSEGCFRTRYALWFVSSRRCWFRFHLFIDVNTSISRSTECYLFSTALTLMGTCLPIYIPVVLTCAGAVSYLVSLQYLLHYILSNRRGVSKTKEEEEE